MNSFITLNRRRERQHKRPADPKRSGIELLTVKEQQIHLNIHHIKTVMPVAFKGKNNTFKK